MSSNPFQAPASADAPLPSEARYRPQTVLTVVVAGLILLKALLTLGSAASGDFIARNDPAVLLGEEPESLATSLAAVAFFLTNVGALLVFLLSGILFFVWLTRANKNARGLGSEGMEFSPGWTVGWFFVPMLNLFKPYQAVQEIYRASDPELEGDSWPASDKSSLVGAWWLSYLLMGVSENAAMVSNPDAVGWNFATIVTPVAAGLAAAMMLSIHHRQTQKLERGKVSTVLAPDGRDGARAPRFLANVND